MFPFKGIITEVPRPWKETGLTTARWINEVATDLVFVRDLWLCQDGVYIHGLFNENLYSRDPLPHVVKWHGELYLEDGHHRVVKAVLAGELYVEARVFSLDYGQT